MLQVKDDTVANHFQQAESEGAITEFETSGSGSLKSSYHEMNVKVRLRPTCNWAVLLMINPTPLHSSSSHEFDPISI